jgi:hypothetical protein
VVDAVDVERHTMTVTTDRDRQVTFPTAYLDDGHVAHGYATTIHKAQGATVDHGLLFGTDALDRSSSYVGMSRGRKTNDLYVAGAAPVDISTTHGPRPVEQDLVEAVCQAMSHHTEKRLALDLGEPALPDDWLQTETDPLDGRGERTEVPALDANLPPERVPTFRPRLRPEPDAPDLGLGL